MMAPALVRRLGLKRYDILSGSLFHCTYFRKMSPIRRRVPAHQFCRSFACEEVSVCLRRVAHRSAGLEVEEAFITTMLPLCGSIPRVTLLVTSSTKTAKAPQSPEVQSWFAERQSADVESSDASPCRQSTAVGGRWELNGWEIWWTWSGSNRRPLPCHGSALPAAPQAHFAEGRRGDQRLQYSLPLTSRSQTPHLICSIAPSESASSCQLSAIIPASPLWLSQPG